jgi:hypothetical protein
MRNAHAVVGLVRPARRRALARSSGVSAAAWVDAARSDIDIDIDPVPLADVEKTWLQTGHDHRVVFVP